MPLPERIENALLDYDLGRDRDVPPVFVGRAEELRFLRRTAAMAAKGARGMTAVVQGVPGAGKSALCAEFVARMQADLSDESPLVVIAKPSRFFDNTPLGMVKELALDVPVVGDLLGRLPGFSNVKDHLVRAADATTALLKSKSTVDLALQAMNLDQASSLGATLDEFAQALWPKGITIVLAIDELQRIRDTPHVRDNLGEIHDKLFNTNMVVVGFGLQNTTHKLNDLGLSRLAADQTMTLAGIESDDSAALVEETFNLLGLSAEDRQWRTHARELGFAAGDWTRWRGSAKAVILEESFNFAHHLVNGIRAACRVVLGGGLHHPGQDALDALRECCRDSKEEYYAARLKPFAAHTVALAAALRTANEAGHMDEGVLQRALETSDNRGLEVDREVASATLEGMVERGLLSRHGMGAVAVAIESLTDHLACQFGEALAQDRTAARKLAKSLHV